MKEEFKSLIMKLKEETALKDTDESLLLGTGYHPWRVRIRFSSQNNVSKFLIIFFEISYCFLCLSPIFLFVKAIGKF